MDVKIITSMPWTPRRYSATLGKFLPGNTAKMQPPWAEHNFSHRFTGLPPVEVYENDQFEFVFDDGSSSAN